jgi:hypothetical protein
LPCQSSVPGSSVSAGIGAAGGGAAGAADTAGAATDETGCCDGRASVELAAEFGNSEERPLGRRKSRAISDSIASIFAAVSIASVRARSLSGAAAVGGAARGAVGAGLRLTGPGSGRPTAREAARPLLAPWSPLSLGSFLKKEKTTNPYPTRGCDGRTRRAFAARWRTEQRSDRVSHPEAWSGPAPRVGRGHSFGLGGHSLPPARGRARHQPTGSPTGEP